MILSKKLLNELQRRLKVGNRRGVHLNAIPARSKYKFDFFNLNVISQGMPNEFLNALLANNKLDFKIGWKNNIVDLNNLFEEEQAELIKLSKSFEVLAYQTQTIEKEKGINTFGFGFPLLIRRDDTDNELTVAPLIIWSLKIKDTKDYNTWKIYRNEDDPIYINEVLINHIEHDAKIQINPIEDEILEKGFITKKELIDICIKFLHSVNSTVSNDIEQVFQEKIKEIVRIKDKSHYLKLPISSTNALIEFGGLFSIFEVQKHNIINNYDDLLSIDDLTLSQLDPNNSFQPLSSVDTDPSQQEILNALSSTKNLLIQGPPGTGKSQTLTAILINALENNKKTLVVCEKKTALDVLENAIAQRGMGHNCILINDLSKDRKSVVESVRERIDNSFYYGAPFNYSKDNLKSAINRAQSLINEITKRDKKLKDTLFGNKTWTQIVGEFLKHIRSNSEGHSTNKLLRNQNFEFTIEEFNRLLELIEKAKIKYDAFSRIEVKNFINNSKLVGTNPFSLYDKIDEDFNNYEEELKSIKNTYDKLKTEFFNIRKAEFDKDINEIEKNAHDIFRMEQAFQKLCETIQNEYKIVRNEDYLFRIEFVKNSIEKILKFENQFETICNELKYNYFNARNTQIENIIEKISILLNDIQNILKQYKDPNLSFNTEKINSYSFKLSQLFSSTNRKISKDARELKSLFAQLKNEVRNSQDLPDYNFDGDVLTGIEQLKNFSIEFNNLKNNYKLNVEKEFDALDLESLLNHEDPKMYISQILIESRQDLKEYLQVLFKNLNNYIDELELNLNDLKNALNSTLDYNFEFNLTGSINDKFKEVGIITKNINSLNENFDQRVEDLWKNLGINHLLVEPELARKKLDEFINIADSKERKYLENIRCELLNFQTEIKNLYYSLRKRVEQSKFISFRLGPISNYLSAESSINQLFKSIEITKKDIDQKFENEFNKFDKLSTNSEYKLSALGILRDSVQNLIERYRQASWTNRKITQKTVEEIIKRFEFIIEEKKNYFSDFNLNFKADFDWHQFINNLSSNDKEIIDELKSSINWNKDFIKTYLNLLLRKHASIDLPVDDKEHYLLKDTLKFLKKDQLKYIDDLWKANQAYIIQKFEQKNEYLTVRNLYNKKSSRQNIRRSLRQIVERDIDLFTTFFPIILTTPDIASNLFQHSREYFDIVLFDEASQLRLEDTLPAFLKGKQIVIAGDEHQMPPSNYFSKIYEGDVDNEDEIDEEVQEIEIDKSDKEALLLACESLLEFAHELDFEEKYLDFHYRSRHPYLIEFSNFAFYKQRLRPLPNTVDYNPIKYINVAGTYNDGINELEADTVISIIENNIHRMKNGEYPSVGVATFNIHQRNLVLQKIREREKFSKYEDFNQKMVELYKKGFFVKNLENIQGDEKDVIILSTTFGKDKNGKFSQKFGPINQSKGKKLLNVIITRAKYKIYCCTSIPEDYIIHYKDLLLSEKDNNKRAVFYAYLAYCKAISEGNNELRESILSVLEENSPAFKFNGNHSLNNLESPFEEEVYNVLMENLDPKKLASQVKFGGFRIDIVYDPQVPGIPKIAIECDGKSYHSSSTAYLYDLHRQNILEKNGFVFHRIWSTNWWKNYERETIKLLDFIKKIENENSSEKKVDIEKLEGFRDEIILPEINNCSTDLENEFEDAVETQNIILNFNKDSHNESVIVVDKKPKIGSQSIVKIKYLNSGQDIWVEIVEKKINPKEMSGDGIHKIYHKSPLAISIIDHSVGDVVRLGAFENFVEIIEIK